jgi:hypothetical protein
MTNRAENRFFAAMFAATCVAIVLVVVCVDTPVTVALRAGIRSMVS